MLWSFIHILISIIKYILYFIGDLYQASRSSRHCVCEESREKGVKDRET